MNAFRKRMTVDFGRQGLSEYTKPYIGEGFDG
jgi:hypothetical protein